MKEEAEEKEEELEEGKGSFYTKPICAGIMPQYKTLKEMGERHLVRQM